MYARKFLVKIYYQLAILERSLSDIKFKFTILEYFSTVVMNMIVPCWIFKITWDTNEIYDQIYSYIIGFTSRREQVL